MIEHMPEPSDLILYRTEDGQIRIEVHLADETVWMTQTAMAELYQGTKQNISLHLKNIFADRELQEDRVVKEYLTTAADGKKYQTKFYNLEAILSVGYRVRSPRGAQEVLRPVGPLYPPGSELTPEEYKSLRFQFGIFKRGLKFLRCQIGTSKRTLTRFD